MDTDKDSLVGGTNRDILVVVHRRHSLGLEVACGVVVHLGQRIDSWRLGPCMTAVVADDEDPCSGHTYWPHRQLDLLESFVPFPASLHSLDANLQ